MTAIRNARDTVIDRVRASGPFAFGASSLGNLYQAMDDDVAQATVDAAWNAGVRLFDAAPFYGFGLSEIRLGTTLASKPRESFLLSTKVGRVLVPGRAADACGFVDPLPSTPVFDYSYDGVMRSFEASLGRLGLDRIDVLLMHDLGQRTHGRNHDRMAAAALDGGFRAMTELRDTGCVAAIGLGVNETEICRQCVDRVDLDILLVANRYSLLDPSGDAFFRSCRDRGIGIIAAGVFSSGILATGTRNGAAYHDYAPASSAVRDRVARIEAVCDTYGVRLGAAALQFVAAHPAVTLPMIGAASSAQVEECVAMMDDPIPPAFWIDIRDEGPTRR